MLKTFYDACMNVDQTNALKSDALLNDIKSFGYWPSVYGDKWQEDDFNLGELMASLAQSRALDVFVDIYVYVVIIYRRIIL